MTRGEILIVPAHEKGKGGGHLCRCITLTCDLRAAGRTAWLFLPQSAQTGDLFQSMNFNPEWRITNEQLTMSSEQIEYIILDRFQTSCEELSRWKKIAPVIGIDEGGKSRDSFDFLIDILIPEKMAAPKANISSVTLLKFPPIPHQKDSSPTPHSSLLTSNSSLLTPHSSLLKVLITFGQEDAAGLGQKTARALSAMKGMDITLPRGALAKGEAESLPNVRVIETIPKLAEHLGEYDLVVTHYGITAFEALYAGTMVVLASPTKYHAKLAKAAGFITWEWGIGNGEWGCCLKSMRSGRSTRLLTSLPTPYSLLPIPFLKKHCKELAAKYGLDREQTTSLADLCNKLFPQVNRNCQLCGADVPDRSVARFNDRTYRRCHKCGVIFMDRSCPPPIEYEREYFFESYKQQYGKTYLEDFQNIKEQGKRRLKIINSLLPAKKNDDAERSLLDIGCAYGPFLAAAREEGFSPAGIDPSEDAVRYVQKELAIPAVVGFFPEVGSREWGMGNGERSPVYDVVSLWFVIEHFTDCAAVLAAIKKILKPAGIIAFSTPSFSGISGRSSLRRFLSASPADHFTVWSPVMCKKALARAGFKVKKIVSIGHHPERFPLLGKFAKSKKFPLYWPLLAISKIFRLGDTFEVYASRE